MITTDETDELGPGPPIDSLRWLGSDDDPAGRTWHQPDDPAVEELRQKLEANNGMKGLELVDPREEGFAKRAARLFLRDGYVAVRASELSDEFHDSVTAAAAELDGEDDPDGSERAAGRSQRVTRADVLDDRLAAGRVVPSQANSRDEVRHALAS